MTLLNRRANFLFGSLLSIDCAWEHGLTKLKCHHIPQFIQANHADVYTRFHSTAEHLLLLLPTSVEIGSTVGEAKIPLRQFTI